MPSWAWVVTGYEIVNTLFTDVSMPSWAWVVTTFKKVSRQNYDVSMPSRAWVVTYEGAKAWLILMFQCPLGLELLRHDANRKVCTIHVSMPSRAWVVTFKLRSSPQHGLCFNALMGLSCYNGLSLGQCIDILCFNALMGLSCYCKNVQYFKFFMILFMHTCYL